MTESSKLSLLNNEFKDTKKELTNQIDNIGLRQQELQRYIYHTESAVQTLENFIAIENKKPKPNSDKIRNYYAAISKNIELLTKLHDVYKSYEDVKYKYHKQVSDTRLNYTKLIEIDIAKIEHTLKSNIDSGGFKDLVHVLVEGLRNNSQSNPDPLIQQCQNDLISDPNYKM